TKAMGLKILPPSINTSGKQFTVVDGKIVYGLQGIKNVGAAAVESILKERMENGPYTSFLDFLYRSEPKALNSRLVESLINAGAFDTLKVNRPTLLANAERAIKYAAKRKESTAFGQVSLFDADEEASMETFEMEEVEDSTLLEKLQIEKQLLGFYVSGHPLDMYRDAWSRSVSVNLQHLDKIPTGRSLNLVAMVTQVREHVTKGGAGKRMAFMQLADFNGEISAVVFPQAWETIDKEIHVDSIYGFTGKFEMRNSEMSYIIENITEPDKLEPTALKEAHLSLLKQFCSEQELRNIVDTCISFPGPLTLMIHVHDELPVEEQEDSPNKKKDTIIKAGRDFSVAYRPDLESAIREFQAVDDIWFV
ncbi:MAG: OB-fold nucleic acid binding domain-containing protein, partial [Sphaerochaetaceae bacterium]|nr:OB-fold nucleic acid binding domain-containing protein [Sphaerochaetaceae bacterium]